jgi:hypothetical protein
LDKGVRQGVKGFGLEHPVATPSFFAQSPGEPM